MIGDMKPMLDAFNGGGFSLLSQRERRQGTKLVSGGFLEERRSEALKGVIPRG